MKNMVVATACPKGISTPGYRYQVIRFLDEETLGRGRIPRSAVADAVADAVERAWKDGHDPAVEPFEVLVTFK